MEHLKSDLSTAARKDAASSGLQTILFVMSLVLPFLATSAFAPKFNGREKKEKLQNKAMMFIERRLSF